jgi:tRNA threonylcarbamoyl adenosine modification protein (Sua5/YciO/YrdC/YwlC family)
MVKIIKNLFYQVNDKVLHTCVEEIKKGNVIVAATETGFCYFGSAGKKEVLEKFSLLRGTHPKTKPFSLMFSNLGQVSQFAELETPAYRLAAKILPGPFTLILRSSRHTPQNALIKTKNTVGVRMTQNLLIESLCQETEYPLLVSSVTDNDELLEEHYYDKKGEIWQDAWWAYADTIAGRCEKYVSTIVDPGDAIFLRSSTMIDFSSGQIHILRDSGWNLDSIV